MRPRKDFREALAQAALALQQEQGAATWRQLAARAQVGSSIAHATVRNMARAGELHAVGVRKPAGSDRWQRLYEPAQTAFSSSTPDALDHVLRGWASFR